MSIFKRGRTYWFHFWFNGEHVQKSTKQGNPRTARQIEAAERTRLAKGEVGFRDRKPVLSFNAAMKAFLAWSEQEHAAQPCCVTFSRKNWTPSARMTSSSSRRSGLLNPENARRDRFAPQRSIGNWRAARHFSTTK